MWSFGLIFFKVDTENVQPSLNHQSIGGPSNISSRFFLFNTKKRSALPLTIPPQVWDAKTTENLHTFHPALSIGSHTEASVHTVFPLPGSTEQVLVSNRTSTAFLCTLQGQVVRSFTSPKVTNRRLRPPRPPPPPPLFATRSIALLKSATTRPVK